MASTKLTNLRGPKGAEGAEGPEGGQGIPGVNAVENDTAVGTYLRTEGTESERAARDKIAASLLNGSEIHLDTTRLPAGELTETTAGQEIILRAGPGDADQNTPRLVDLGGETVLTFGPLAQQGGYATIVSDDVPSAWGADFALAPYDDDPAYEWPSGGAPGDDYVSGGNVAAAAVLQPIGENPTGLGPMSIHFRAEPQNWYIDVIDNDTDTSVTPYWAGSFVKPLDVLADLHWYRIMFSQDVDEGVLRFLLPDGTIVQSRPHAAFRQRCTANFIEPYRTPGDPVGKARGVFRRYWASRDPGWVPAMRALAKLAQPGVFKSVYPGPLTQDLGGSPEYLGGSAAASRVVCQRPSDGYTQFTVELWLENDADFNGRNILLLLNDADAELVSADLNRMPGYKGAVTATFLYAEDTTGITNSLNAPGSVKAYRFKVISTNNGKSRLRFGQQPSVPPSTLSADVGPGAGKTSLPVNALAEAIASETKLKLSNGQFVTTSAVANAGATSIPVVSFELLTFLASGSTVIGVSSAGNYSNTIKVTTGTPSA